MITIDFRRCRIQFGKQRENIGTTNVGILLIFSVHSNFQTKILEILGNRNKKAEEIVWKDTNPVSVTSSSSSRCARIHSLEYRKEEETLRQAEWAPPS